ncbi:hypothetical protein CQ020_03695 [Arthrobacter sp. MYb23]|uniref:hypothetical protein n=1 Tax=unclassified Arthrobacter TaxID=235627 RepID=UPI000CFAB9B7|nr:MULTISPECIES: hypothetical protein [unclassified Arthrobacter]PRB44323.1 hypothetical protein CQ038_03550 [Arthrobacter sp. MYb51]PRB98575.1 hypothetical protein CQ020_03695 [Arthrobacter sp. MYb23]
MSRVPEAIARTIAYALDAEFFDSEGLFFSASPDGANVRLIVEDAETDEQTKFTLKIEVAA